MMDVDTDATGMDAFGVIGMGGTPTSCTRARVAAGVRALCDTDDVMVEAAARLCRLF